MKSTIHQRLLLPGAMSAADTRALVGTAAMLRQAAERGVPQPLLRGKNVAVLSTDPQSPMAAAFDRAASGLGARVSHVKTEQALAGDSDSNARVLGKLYDALACDNLPKDAALRLQRQTDRPVVSDAPLAGLLAAMPQPRADDLHYLMQAVLVHAVA